MKSQLKSASGKTHPAGFRLSVLAGACVLAMGSSLAYGKINYTLTTNSPAIQTLLNDNYMIWVSSPQLNSGVVSGTVTSDPKLTAISLSGAGATPAALTNNSASAVAAGNQNTTTANLSLITNPAGALDGIGTLATQVRQTGNTNALVDSSVVSITEVGMLAATATITGNTLSATATLNRSDTTASGVVPVGYVSTATGSIDVGYKPATGTSIQNSAFSTTLGVKDPAATAASVNLNTFQTSKDASSNALSNSKVTASTVKLDLSMTTGAAGLDQSLTVSSNALSAEFSVNKSSNLFNATAGSAAFTGSVAVTNVQANIETAAAATSAEVSTSSITSNITRRDPGLTPTYTSLTGALEQSSNTISATSSGNSAGSRNAAGTILVGNDILFSGGSDLTGSGSTTANVQASSASQATSTTQSDLALLNLQRNDSTNQKSLVDAGVISARADNVTSGSITLNSNTVAASAEGNLSGNRIAAIATNSSASAAAANVQANAATPIQADNSGSSVKAAVGYLAQTTGHEVAGTVTLNQNSLSATASGNASSTNVVMLAANLSAQASTAGAASVVVATGATTATAGLSATNLQSNISSATVPGDISASVGTAQVAALFTEDGLSTPATAVPLAGAVVSLNQNALKAAATGNSASTGVTITGAAGAASNATVQAAVGNSQLNDKGSSPAGTNMAIESILVDAGVRTLGGATSSSQLSVNSNTLDSSATGSSASNTLAATVTNLTVGPNVLALGPASVSTTTATSTAALGLASVQINQALITSENTVTAGSAFAGVRLSSAAGSQLTVNDNQASSNNTGNRANNAITVDATTIASTTGGANAIAAVSNLQTNAVLTNTAPTASSATVGAGASLVPTMGVQVDGAVTAASALTVSGNAASATALGNTGSNALTVTGTNLTSTAPAVTAGLASTGLATGGSVSSEFALANFQNDSVADKRTANATDLRVGINVAGALTNSSLTVANNQIVAEARNNQISNAASLTGFSTLKTSAGVLNEQNASTAVTSTVAGANTSVKAADAVSSAPVTVTIDKNIIQGLALGSSADNSLAGSAAVLTGNPKAALSGTGTIDTATITQVADFSLANSQQQLTGALTADVTGTQTFSDGAFNITAAQLTVSGNAVNGIAQSLSATNALELAGATSATVTAALGNLQVSSSAVSATTTPVQGVSTGTVLLTTSDLTVSSNTAKAQAVGAAADNSLRATAAVLNGNTQSAGSRTGYTSTDRAAGVIQRADFALSSSQSQTTGAVAATLVTGEQTIKFSGAAATTGSKLTVNGNTLQSIAESLSATNALDLAGTTSATATAALGNLQVSTSAVSATTVATQGVSGATAIGVGTVATVDLTVSNNTAKALALGAMADNRLSTSAAVLAGNPLGAATETGISSADQLAVTLAQTADFSLVNTQSQKTGAVAAIVTGTQTVYMGGAGTLANASPFSVTGNSVQGIAEGLSASNALALAGATSASASAALANLQVNASDVSATTTATQGVIAAAKTADAGSNLTVSGNAAKALAVGGSATNALSVDSANLSGNSKNKVLAGGSSFVAATPVAKTTADFAIANVQDQSGAMASTLTSTQMVKLTAAAVEGGAITVSRNTANSVAQANSASSDLSLTGANQSGLTAALLSEQKAVNTVTASQAVASDTSTFAIKTTSLGATATGVPVTVSGNSVLASAGMNEAFNKLTASGAMLSADAARGNETAQYALTGVVTDLASASSGAAFSVQNVQSGATAAAGGVTATADPQLIGIANTGNVANSSTLTVSDNTVTAKANVNYADNALNMPSSNTLAGAASVSNVQTSAVTSVTGVTATVGSASTTYIGIAPPVPATNVNGSSVTVSGNALNAQVGGNMALNALEASAANSISNGGLATSTSTVTGTTSGSNLATFAVLNYQGNNSAMNATVQNATIGMTASTTLVNSNATVQGNQILAWGYGNSASNSLTMNALNGNSNLASAGITNVQYNLASIAATVSGVSNGITGSAGVSGGTATVSGNSVLAQAVGNSAVNRIMAR